MKRRDFWKTACLLVSWVGLLAGPAPSYAIDAPGIVRGRVTSAGQALAGVLVSDGCRVARTDAQGEYELSVGPDSGAFVFVTTPRGHWVDPFYAPADKAAQAGRADFALRPIDQPDRFHFVFLTDVHLDSGKIGIGKFRASLEEINGLDPTPAFLWAQGDICLQGHAGPAYVDCLGLAKMPVRNGAGNHEMMLDHRNPRDDFERLLGPTYYSFDWGPIHCIVLDGNKPIPGGKDYKAVHGAVEGSELAWLEADLAAQPKGKPIVVGVHIPIVTTYPQRRRKSPEDAPYWEMTNRKLLTDLFSRHGVRLVLQGHMHENERAVVGGVEYVASISISGSWWKSGAGIERGVDGSPRGYRLVSVDGGRISHRYVSSCESRVDRPGEFVGLGEQPLAGAPAEFLFNCYDAPNGSTAEVRLDGGPWLPMPAYPALSPSTPDLAMPHHFRLAPVAGSLGAGRHTVEARVRWPDQVVVSYRQPFMIGKKD